ncbi:hypothetical protein SERLADRAFT_473063, partial [Serpula lacrymans var. lacrymans S7.9]
MTPQRASQIFDFLTEKKKKPEERLERLLCLPSPKNSPPSRFSSDSVSGESQTCDLPASSDTTSLPIPLSAPDQVSHVDINASSHNGLPLSNNRSLPAHKQPTVVREELDVPTLVTSNTTGQSSRGPRGPRAPSNIPTKVPKANVENWEPAANPVRVRHRRTFAEMSNSKQQGVDVPAQTKATDAFTTVPSRSSRHQSSSRASISMLLDVDQSGKNGKEALANPLSGINTQDKSHSLASTPPCDKENNTTIFDSQLPRTPIRPPGIRAIIDVP